MFIEVVKEDIWAVQTFFIQIWGEKNIRDKYF